MHKKRVWMAVVILSLLCFAGCRKQEIFQTPVVTGIRITCSRADGVITREYTQPEKMRRVLYYLRRQQTKGYAVVDPERVIGDVFWIQVQLSDGQSHVYRQRADKFLSLDCGRWKNIDESYGRRLYYLLHAIPSDPIAVAKEGIN